MATILNKNDWLVEMRTGLSKMLEFPNILRYTNSATADFYQAFITNRRIKGNESKSAL
jgi:hypothetical protein